MFQAKTIRAKTIRIVHAFPNAWFPAPDKNLVIEGIAPPRLAEICRGKTVVSHVRYEDHAKRISDELSINLEASGINAPSPFESDDMLVVASLSPGSHAVSYVVVYDASAIMVEAGIM